MRRIVNLIVSLLLLTCATKAHAEMSLQQQSAQAIETHLSTWYDRNRPDRVDAFLAQLLRVDPDNPLVLEANFLVKLQQNDVEGARTLLRRLRGTAPHHPATIRATELFTLETELGEQHSQARLLYLAGQYEKSAELYRILFPNQPEHTQFVIDYWLAHARAGDTQSAINALSRLHREQPANGRLEIALYRVHYIHGSLTHGHLAALNELTQDPVFGVEAVFLWQQVLPTLAVNERNFEPLSALYRLHPNNHEISAQYYRFKSELEAQQALFANPAYQLYLSGVRALEDGNPERAELLMLRAIESLRDIPEIYGNLGYATLRQGKHHQAVRWFDRANQLDVNTEEWAQMEQIALFWAAIEDIDAALLADDTDTAARILRQLQMPYESDSAVLLRRARVADTRQQYQRARDYYDQVIALEPTAEQAIWGAYSARLNIHGEQSEAIMDWVDSLSTWQFNVIRPEVNRRQALSLLSAGDQAADNEQWSEAIGYWRSAYRLTPDDPWLTFRLAGAYEREDDDASALALFDTLIERSPSDDATYAYALILARMERYEQSLRVLESIDSANMSEDMQSLAQRARDESILNQLQAEGVDSLYSEQSWFLSTSTENQTRALRLISDTVDRNTEWVIPLIETSISQPTHSSNTARGEFLLVASEIAQATGDNRQAATWSQASLETQLAGTTYSLWQLDTGDNWQLNSARNRLARAAQASEHQAHIGWRHDSNSGTAGISEWQADTLMIQVDFATTRNDARWQLRVDPTWVSAGAFDSDDSFWRNRLGTGLLCNEPDCDVSGVLSESDDFGIAVGIARQGERVSFDLGSSPIGFELSTWVGGVETDGQIGQMGWSIGAERRVISTNLLSFAGRRDPFSELRWGAVTRNGVNGSLSWDQGGRVGWWGVAGAEYYTGTNVASNTRWYAHNGIYMRVLDAESLAFTVGLTNLNWGFDKTLSRYTYGHGGYYSPAQYNSLSIPLTVFGRYNRLSYSARVSGGFSRAKQHSEAFFPNDSAFQTTAENLTEENNIVPIYSETTSSGFNVGASAQLEYRLSSRWYVGAALSIQRSDTFAPNNGSLYFRYQSGGFSLPPRRPPQSPTPYVDY